jgi:hypothetical protein
MPNTALLGLRQYTQYYPKVSIGFLQIHRLNSHEGCIAYPHVKTNRIDGVALERSINLTCLSH